MRFSDDGRLTETGLRALADEIAEALGPPWKHENTGQLYYRTELVCPDDDWRIAIEVVPGRHKATATGLTPTLTGRWWRDVPAASIGFTATRDPEDIAADMRRRLFPAYARALDTERNGIAKELLRREVFAAAAQQLTGHLPAKARPDLRLQDRDWDAVWTDRHNSYNHARLSSEARTVSLKLNEVPLEVACTVLDLLEGRTPDVRRPTRSRTSSAPRRHARRRAASRHGRVKAGRP